MGLCWSGHIGGFGGGSVLAGGGEGDDGARSRRECGDVLGLGGEAEFVGVVGCSTASVVAVPSGCTGCAVAPNGETWYL